jgi:hypothetical protein
VAVGMTVIMVVIMSVFMLFAFFSSGHVDALAVAWGR